MRRIVAALAVLMGVVVHPAAAGAAGAPPDSAADEAAAGRSAGSQPCEPILVPLGVHLPLGSNDPVAVASTCPGVRPGARLMIGDASEELLSGSSICTMNFVFTDPFGRVYIGTAGHCILKSVGQYPPDDPGTGLTAFAYDDEIEPYRIGTFVFAVRNDVEDFALIRLDSGVAWSPQVCFFGGPVGLNRSTENKPSLLHHFGQGFAFGALTPGRTAVAPTLQDPNRVLAAGVAMLGDSGSPVLDAAGSAIGVMVSIEADAAFNKVGVLGINRLGPEIDEASRVLHFPLSLVTAPPL